MVLPPIRNRAAVRQLLASRGFTLAATVEVRRLRGGLESSSVLQVRFRERRGETQKTLTCIVKRV